MDGESAAYALCRPPGHHAYRDQASGFCFLNNTAVAAAHLRQKHERVAILDVDVHHGNGTQGIFYESPDVLTISIHAPTRRSSTRSYGDMPMSAARGAGVGANLNIPLPLGTNDDGYMQALGNAHQAIAAFARERWWSRSALTHRSMIRSRALPSPRKASGALALRLHGSVFQPSLSRRVATCRICSAPT